MKKLFLLSTIILFSVTIFQAQISFHQLGDKKTAARFAESPQAHLSEFRMLRGFGCFIKVDKSDEQYDNLVGFYEIGKEEEQYLTFTVTAQIVDTKGTVVAKSNTVKNKMIPNLESAPKGLSFAKGTYEKLDEGKYELVITGVPANKEILEMLDVAKPDVRFFFKK